MPLIVAMLGGTGTGKSTLLNALVGEKVVLEGKERPTTAKPTLVCHTLLDPSDWGPDWGALEIVKKDNPTLNQMVILDCPDPDTTENPELRETNLARLRAVLPLCDVLLVTATQQKYRDRKVLDELAQAAPGARLVFVQTHADRDVDIRDDWNELLKKDYETNRIYLVDSIAALRDQQESKPFSKDFQDLRQLLAVDLNDEAAILIRQANFFGLAEETIHSCREWIVEHWGAVRKLRERITEERRRFGERLAEKLRDELIRDRRLWESRLIGRVASQWGFSPFSMVLRIYQGFGAILSSAFLTRVRSVPQLAIWGAFEGIRSFKNWSDNRKVDSAPGAAVVAGWEENRLRESALILAGFATDARIPTDSCNPDFVLEEAKKGGDAFVEEIARELERICNHMAASNNRLWIRAIYETLFGGMILFLIYRPAKNFFFDTMFYSAPLYRIDFYIESLLWLIVWGGLLLGLFTFMLRNGLDREINEVSVKWSRLPALNRFFAGIEAETDKILAFRDDLDRMHERIEMIRQQADKLDKRLGKKRIS